MSYAAAADVEGIPDAAAVQLPTSSTPLAQVLVLRHNAEPARVPDDSLTCEVEPRSVTLPAAGLSGMSAGLVPENVRWELGIIVRRMTAGLGDLSPYRVRVVLQDAGANDAARLLAVELQTAQTGRIANGVWWLPRVDGPGAWVGAGDADYERLLWQSPVEYTRISRGVAAQTATVRRKVTVRKAGGQTTTRLQTVQVQTQHIGIDMAAHIGTSVHAVGDATVTFAGRRSGYGNLVILDHGHGYQTYYAHLSKFGPGVKAGRPLHRGQEVGLVGSTGHSTGPHLHFEVRKDGKYVDPFDNTRRLDFWGVDDTEQVALLRRVLALEAVNGVGVPTSTLAACSGTPSYPSADAARRSTDE
jgi:murein DD-endopeptidase MepM/ murein hydrolase activator NlpD